jgi:hypothetical protein
MREMMDRAINDFVLESSSISWKVIAIDDTEVPVLVMDEHRAISLAGTGLQVPYKVTRHFALFCSLKCRAVEVIHEVYAIDYVDDVFGNLTRIDLLRLWH